MALRPNGQFLQEDFIQNAGGLNNTDSPFMVQDGQAVQGYNYDYTATGGIKKRNGHTLLSATPDAQLRSLNFSLFNTAIGVKTMLRCAGTKLQTFNTSTGACTNITEDTTAAGSTFFSGTQPVVSAQFNTIANNITWFAGGAYTGYGLLGYNGTNATQNGSDSSTVGGSFSLTAGGSDGTLPADTYYYGIALVKASTGAVSNVVLDTSKTVSANQHVVINTSGVTGYDATKYTKMRIYRSGATPSGTVGFTTGDLIATITSGASFTDLGAIQGTEAEVPRAFNILLDNSTLPTTGVCNALTVWKRQLVTAIGSTLYISQVGVSESWPQQNPVTIPSGGPITALGIISYTTPTTSVTDEYLVILKDRELWVLIGETYTDWSLQFIDFVGTANQSLLVPCSGLLWWVDYHGVYVWDGSAKPIFASRLIQKDFASGGDIDLSKLSIGCGGFYKSQTEIMWILSSLTLGEQVLALKLDTRLTIPRIITEAGGRVLEAVIIKDTLPNPMYACLPTLPNYSETFFAGDSSGQIWSLFGNLNSDNGVGINFSYRTRPLDFGLIGTTKRYHKVIVWAQASSLNNLTLNYWVDYQIDSAHQGAAQQQPIATVVTDAIWDQATWDSFYWDQNLITYTPVVFNLRDPVVGTEGDALTLQFSQTDPNAPLLIAGFSVLLTEMGLRK